jgi:beta-galactosidase
MNDIRYDLRYLTDPQVFALGRLPAVSDHDVYAGEEEAATGQSSLNLCLNGRWKFAYAQTPDVRPVGFAAPEYDCAAWGEIDVPAHIQLQGYGMPQYVNTQYPWDGHEVLRPPEILLARSFTV